jgi:hypothetical protein
LFGDFHNDVLSFLKGYSASILKFAKRLREGVGRERTLSITHTETIANADLIVGERTVNPQLAAQIQTLLDIKF